jgi:hypothetical protein
LLEARHLRPRDGADKHRSPPPLDDAAVVHNEGTCREGLSEHSAAPQEAAMLRGHPCPARRLCALYRAGERGRACRCLFGRRLSYATLTGVPPWALTTAGAVPGPVGPRAAAEGAARALPVSTLHGVGVRAGPAAGAEFGRVGPPPALHVTPVGFWFLEKARVAGHGRGGTCLGAARGASPPAHGAVASSRS